MTRPPRHPIDQAGSSVFRWLMVVQLLAAGFFGVVPFLAPAAFAALAGQSGRDEFVYRLAGAAAAGYAVTAVIAVVRRVPWAQLRIPLVATLTFTATAALGSALTVLESALTAMVGFVLVAASAFALLAAYWLIRDEGLKAAETPALGLPAKVVLALATLSAGVFGIMPLLAPTLFAQLFGLDGADRWIFRMAGAACLGYAIAGILEILAGTYPAIRLQNAAAITFNALGATASVLALASGQGGLLAPIIVAAAGTFTVLLTMIAVDGERRSGTA